MKFYIYLFLFLLLSSIPIECMKVIKSHKAKRKHRKKHKLMQKKMKKKKVHKNKGHHIMVQKHRTRHRKLAGGDMTAYIDAVVVTVFLFALIKLPNPVLLFFIVPFLLDIVHKIEKLATGSGGGGGKKSAIPGVPGVPGVPAIPELPSFGFRRKLMNLGQLAQIGSIIQQMSNTQTREPQPQDLGQSLKSFQNPKFQQLFSQLNEFMQSKKIDKTADPQNQIVSLAEEFLTTKYGMQKKGLRKELNNLTAQLISNQGNIMKLLQNNI